MNSEMPFETDERLKGFLDANQLSRERMCLAVMAIDRRFSDVRPRHPRGGRDGARDIEAVFDGVLRTFGAVGFLNQANDSDAHKASAADKFTGDLSEAMKQDPPPEAFVFFTNVNLTIKEKGDLIATARGRGVKHAEVFDRERIRIALDSPDGFAIRFQYLGIPLSEAEQATFFARWGDDIQAVISDGFSRLQGMLGRILFLQEAALPLTGFSVVFELDREYSASEIGHFRAFGSVFLKAPSHNVIAFLFGATDNRARLQARTAEDLAKSGAGIKEGICGGQWELNVPLGDEKGAIDDLEAAQFDEGDPQFVYTAAGSFSAIGRDPVTKIAISYEKGGLTRYPPGPCLMDVDECKFIFHLNGGLARKVKTIRIFANEYKLSQINREEFRIYEPENAPPVPLFFSEQELTDPWVALAPPDVSSFRIAFSEQTPRRFFDPKDIKEP